MPVFQNSEQLYSILELLFDKIKQQPAAAQSLQASRLIIRLSCKNPEAAVVINSRSQPIQVSYGPSTLRPDLDVDLTADALHQILLAEMPLRKALASGQMKVRGPIWKTPALEAILHRGQDYYPQIARDHGLNGAR
jgi:hypothetical protein